MLRLCLAACSLWLLTLLPADAQSAYRPLRYEEDYRVLKASTRANDLWDPLKFVPLNETGSSWVSFGGELRARFEGIGQPIFGLQGSTFDDYVLYRGLFHADLHLGEQLRAFVQLGTAFQAGRDTRPLPVDRHPLDLHQGFVDLSLPPQPDFGLTVRLGRQEMLLGAGRLVGLRDAPNWRRSSDGVRLLARTGDVRLDAFWMRPLILGTEAFENRSDPTEQFWGIYGSFPLRALPDGRADLYYLGVDRRTAPFAAGVAREVRQTVGLRLTGRPGNWSYDLEAAWQGGDFGGQPIRAWGAWASLSHTFANTPLAPTVGLRASAASGDRDRNDGVLETFNPLYYNPNVLTPAVALGASNFANLQPSIGLRLSPALTATVDWQALWRLEAGDAVYRPPLIPLVLVANGGSWLGSQLSTEVQWQLDRHCELGGIYSHFFVGDALSGAGGRDIDFVAGWLTYRF
jgi:hypothetical protein